jgi:hypothetical protein
VAKEPSKSCKDALNLDADEMMELTRMSNELRGDQATVKSYRVRNSRALAKAKSLVVSVRRLQEDALRKDDHSLALSGNMQLARGETQLPGTDAHHIVSRTHRLAKYSRKYLVDWRIAHR